MIHDNDIKLKKAKELLESHGFGDCDFDAFIASLGIECIEVIPPINSTACCVRRADRQCAAFELGNKTPIVDFGKYNYRSCEDILEAVKPLCVEHGVLLTITDELLSIDGRFYVKATAALCSGTDRIESCGYAREDEDKKGMDGAQITGTSSSYARKYALNALLLIDDTKDADTDELANERKARALKDKPKESVRVEEPTEQQKNNLKEACKALGVDVKDVLAKAGFKKGMAFDMELYQRCQSVLKELGEAADEFDAMNP